MSGNGGNSISQFEPSSLAVQTGTYSDGRPITTFYGEPATAGTGGPGASFYVGDYGATGNSVTDDSAAITAAANAANNAGGGNVVFGPQNYSAAGLPLYPNVHYRGAGIGATTLTLRAGANTDLFTGGAANVALINLAAAAGSSGIGSLRNFGVYDMTLDGNKANQTGGPSYCLRFYGYGYILSNLRVRNGYSGGILSDWNGGANSPAGSDSMEAQIENVKIHDCTGWALEMGGPHDTQMSNIIPYNNGGGIHLAPNAAGVVGTDSHVWGIQAGYAAYLIEAGFCAFDNSVAECPPTIGVVILANNFRWNGMILTAGGSTSVGGIQLGQAAGGTPITGSILQSAGLTTAAQVSGCLIDAVAVMSTTTGYAFSYANDGGYNVIRLLIYMTAAGATPISGGSVGSDQVQMNVHGVTADGTVAKAGQVQFSSNGPHALRITGNGPDLFNVDAFNLKTQFVGGMKAQFFSDNYTTQKVGISEDNAGSIWCAGYLASGQSATAAATATGGTITTASTGVARVAPVAAITGVILQAGTKAGQQVTVVNESANSVTFAASGTSFVADGVSDVIAATSARMFIWDSGTALWYRLQ